MDGVSYAVYGVAPISGCDATSGNHCSSPCSSYQQSGCGRDLWDYARLRCVGQQSCILSPLVDTGDPCGGMHKAFAMVWHCAPFSPSATADATSTSTGTGSISASPSPSLTSSSSSSSSISASAMRTSSSSSSSTSSRSATQTSSLTPSSSLTSGVSCPPTHFRPLPRTDLVGAPLTDEPLAVSSEGACRIACCGTPSCNGYAFASTELRFGAASCFLLANVSATAPNNAFASGLRMGVALPGLPASASPVGTPMRTGGGPQRGASLSPTQTASVFVTPTRSYIPSLPTPLLHYAFEGDYQDSSANAAHLAATYPAGFVNGISGRAVSFLRDGGSVLSSINTIPGLPAGASPRTVSVWVKPSVDAMDSFLVSWGNTRPTTFLVFYCLNAPGASSNGLQITSASSSARETSVVPPAGYWTHIVATMDSSVIRGYLNASLVLEIGASGNTDHDTNLYVGAPPPFWGNAQNEHVSGAVDELMIWNTALTQQQIASMYNMMTLPPSSTPSPSSTPYCQPSLFRSLPRMDLVGTLVGTALAPGAPALTSSLSSCRQACCDAPSCEGFSFVSGDAQYLTTLKWNHADDAESTCFLYVNITQLIPNSAFSSGIYESTL